MLIFPGALGDLLLVLPTLRRLRRRHRPARTVLVVGEPQRALARMLDVADTVASLDDADAAWLFGGSAVPRWLAPDATVFSWLGTREPLGERMRRLAADAHLLSVERGPGPVHAAVAYARAAGVAADRRRLATEAAITPPSSVRAATLVEGLRRPLLALHHGAGAPAKRWALEGFADVASWWRRSRGDVIELLGPAEDGEPPLTGTRTAAGWALPDVAALLGLADGYVGNDSGVSHLAGAVGTPGVVLFRVTAPSRWRPLSPRLVALRGDVEAGEVGRALAELSAGSVACARSGSAS